jgi:hypothetical protein
MNRAEAPLPHSLIISHRGSGQAALFFARSAHHDPFAEPTQMPLLQ